MTEPSREKLLSSGLVLIVGILSGCSAIQVDLATSSYCEVDAASLPTVVANVQAVADRASDDRVKYSVSTLLTEEGRLFRDGKGCWTYLLATSAEPEREILEGIGGVYIDESTLETGEIYLLRE